MTKIDWSSWNGTLAGYWYLVEKAREKAPDDEDDDDEQTNDDDTPIYTPRG